MCFDILFSFFLALISLGVIAVDELLDITRANQLIVNIFARKISKLIFLHNFHMNRNIHLDVLYCISNKTLRAGPGCDSIDHFGGCGGWGDETRDHHGQYLLLKQQ